MDDEIFVLLGEALVTSPATGSKLLRHEELHRLLELTGGSVYLRHRDWCIIPRRHGRLYVRIELRQE